ncbi:MAG: inorganic phosphate transporter [Candidatus Kapaibacteriota bacterium]
MEQYFVFVAILIVLAIIDLTVGVANDAINFLNGAIGSNAAKMKTILIFASLGILVGVTFSAGMMEVARKGVFNPTFFTLPEVLIIFVALMIQDVILLDVFNSYGLPTSTTVTLIFGLLGGSLAIGMLKILGQGQDLSLISQYINSANILTFVSAILVSIVLAFTAGALIQFLTRLIFSFNYKPTFRKYGSIWAGVALTSLSYFVIIKGLKGATFLTDDNHAWIKGHTQLIMFILFAFWTIFTQFVMWFTKFEVLKIIVLFGTFALAMAFAANDLVNFIGAPLASYLAYKHVAADPSLLHQPMEFLNGKIQIPTELMLLCGAIMVATLYFSKKQKTVSKTEIGLATQNEGLERFESNLIARFVVRVSINTFKAIKKILPNSLIKFVNSRFDLSQYHPEVNDEGQKQAYDLLRGAVILMVSAALISLGTAYKLPLSTTYVTFIVAMAAALPDKAWGRDSAVYRVSGVLTVVGGWFLTAFSAAFFSFLIATILFYGGIYALVALFALTLYILYKNSMSHKKREAEIAEMESKYNEIKVVKNTKLSLISEDIAYYLGEVKDIFNNNYLYLKEENVIELKKNKKRAKKTNELSNAVMAKILVFMKNEKDSDPEMQFNLSKVTVALQEISDRLFQISAQSYNYIDNNHVALGEVQVEEYNLIIAEFHTLVNLTIKYIETSDDKVYEEVIKLYQSLNNIATKYNKNQLKRVKNATSNVRRSMLYISLLNDADRICDSCIKICNSVRAIEKNEISL